ncbi:unnamed protein product [Albugo candida]|uniref:Uncharacterized protein n=1 Tax=Albugo candida TaxID=65357 RepID=A0A024FWA3_9STRA|nr:unnamed protein product [Albugo candida]|eukprot:CCI11197.1 unnamed protein product [Albugo candida]
MRFSLYGKLSDRGSVALDVQLVDTIYSHQRNLHLSMRICMETLDHLILSKSANFVVSDLRLDVRDCIPYKLYAYSTASSYSNFNSRMYGGFRCAFIFATQSSFFLLKRTFQKAID